MDHKEQIRIVHGSHNAVLMIHGIVGTPLHFRDLIPIIPQDWSVYNLLLDGHGQGVREFAKTSMEKWKTQVRDKLREILESHEQVLIVGHSMGSLFAIQAGIDYPDRIPALFLMGCPLRVHMPPKTMALSVRTALGCTDPGATAMRNDCSVKLTPKLWRYLSWVPRFWELLAESRRVRGLLPGLNQPTLCCQSRRDELVSMRSCGDLAGNPVITTVVLENSGHFAYSPEDTEILQDGLRDVIQQFFI